MKSSLVILAICLQAGDGQATAPRRALTPVDESRPVAVPVPSPKAVRYARGNEALWIVNHAWAVFVPSVVFASGLSIKMRELALRLGRHWLLVASIFGLLYFGFVALVDLPWDVYEGFWRQHAYGLSKKPAARWMGDWLKASGISVGLIALFIGIPHALTRRAPRTWWLWTGLLCVPYLLGVAYLKPVLFDPLFNRFGPMHNERLEREVLEQASRAGIAGSRVFEVDKSRDTTTVNAYVTGLFGTKRIVIWDTLLAQLNDRQVLFVVAHEIGHYVLGHVVKGLLVSGTLILAGLGLVHAISKPLLRKFGQRWRIAGVGDLAAIPLLIAMGQVVALVLTPLGYAYSRHIEHEADRFALELTHANHSGATSFVILQRANLSLPRHDWFTATWRSTHPSLADRIDFCNTYRPWAESSAGRPHSHGLANQRSWWLR
jgi:Zn-dependent protease with chaperone function